MALDDYINDDAGNYVVGVELGGTKCVCVLGTPSGDIVAHVRIPTTSPGRTLPAIERVLDGWASERGFSRIGIASFGPIDMDIASSHWGSIGATAKPGWSNANLAQRLRARFGQPIAVTTDVVGAALAEGRWGAAQGLQDYAYVTVGTGVGAGIIASGRALGGFGHSELGHIRVGRVAGDDWPGACPYHGDCVEGLASGSSTAARCGRPAESLGRDDPAWNAVAAALAGMLQTLIMTATPRLILIGGGVVIHNIALLDAVRAHLRRGMAGYLRAPILDNLADYVRAPGLGGSAGPLGALATALTAETFVPHFP